MEQVSQTEQAKKGKMVPLNPEQHPVTAVPKFSHSLPFFNLTANRRATKQTIRYAGTDDDGRAIRWEVYPNTSREVGPPCVEAHQVWVLLVKPSIDAALNQYGKIPAIVPLGGVRECLRKVGWTAGGHQGRELIRALTQISFAGCKADFWLPTGQLDELQRRMYKQITGAFSRMSVYAIGERHVTEEDLVSGNFTFDLQDTVYVRLDPIEVLLQSSQDQRPLDNQYLFSVGPAARRWYELVAPKIFGVIKNKGQFCDVAYSWYCTHHHTLKRFYERRRVVEQMNEVVRDHRERGYISRVEYYALQKPGQGLDFTIRYWPGPGADDSLQRILSALRQKGSKQSEQLANPPAIQAAKQTLERRSHPLLVELSKRGIGEKEARKILTGLRPEQNLLDVLEWADFLIAQAKPGKILNAPGFIIHLIKEGIVPPPEFETSSRRTARDNQKREENQRLQALLSKQAQEEEKRQSLAEKQLNERSPEEYEKLYKEEKERLFARLNIARQWDSEIVRETIHRALIRKQLQNEQSVVQPNPSSMDASQDPPAA